MSSDLPHPVRAPRPHIALILLAALIATLPLLFRGASCGHDLDFHLNSWLDVAAQWRHGILVPRWAFSPAWGAGEPRFLFYPPISWLLGGFFALVLPIRFVPVLFTCFALAASGLTMRRLAAEFTAPQPALLAAVFYLANPYMLFTAYERCAYGELLAAAWIPLLILSILTPQVSVRRVAVAIALLWLTNGPAALMSTYLFALLALARLAIHVRGSYLGRHLHALTHFSVRVISGIALGLGLAAAYLLPASHQKRFIQTRDALLPYYRIQDNTLFHRTPDLPHDIVLHTASLIAVLLLALTAVFCIVAWRRWRPAHRRLFVLLFSAAAAIALALTPISLPVWSRLPQMPYIQFPWRMLALLACLCALLYALSLRTRPRSLLLAALVIPAALTPLCYHPFHRPCVLDDAPAPQLRYFQSGVGSQPSDEYTYWDASNDSLLPGLNTWWTTNALQSVSLVAPGAPATILFQSAEDLHISASHGRFLVLRLRNYPSWRVTVNGISANSLSRDDGLIAVTLPVGPADVSVRFRSQPDEFLGLALSLISLTVLLLLRRRARRIGMDALTLPIPAGFMPSVQPS